MTTKLANHKDFSDVTAEYISDGLYITYNNGKFGLHDNTQKKVLLPIENGSILIYDGTTYLWVYSADLKHCGVYDRQIKAWLVPQEYEEIYLTYGRVLSFVVYLKRKKGTYYVLQKKCVWDT